MNIKEVQRAYFIGIGGIGMSALARYFLDNGIEISGYDKTPSNITFSFEHEGVPVHYSDDVARIPEEVRENKKDSLIVYTPAIPKNHKELNYLQEQGFEVKKRSEVLGEITKDKFTIAVAGTHGKTSTAGFITHMLKSAGIECYALIGGVTVNYGSNYISPENKDSDIFIIEADEFDRSFLQLNPDISIITSTDADHLDIYGNHENLLNTYQEFAERVERNGSLICYDQTTIKAPEHCKKHLRFGLEKDSDYRAQKVRIKNSEYHFDIHTQGRTFEDIKLSLGGEHNVLNALASLAASSQLTETKKLITAIESYRGIKRRFEYIIKQENLIYIDDYAHHPSELDATIASVKKLYPGKKVTGIFQPHLFSRTRDFAAGFANSLDQLDRAILIPVYPARELPIPGITSNSILELMTHENALVLGKEEMLRFMVNEENEVILTLGAGDIDRLVAPLKEVLITRTFN